MKLQFWVALAIVFVFVSSCNSFPLNFQGTVESTYPVGTATPPVKKATVSVTPFPVEPEETIVQTSTSAVSTQDFPGVTSTIIVTESPGGPTQSPTMTPKTDLVINPSETHANLKPQIGSPVGLPNFAHPDLGCQWMGVAGQIFDSDNLPWEDLVVEVGGTLEGKPVFGLAVTGKTETYGPGGYEIKLSDRPIGSSKKVWVQIFDLGGNEMSPLTYFSTYSECDKNLILLNLVQIIEPPEPLVYLPIIFNVRSDP